MKKILLASMLAGLAACASSPQQSLSEKLQGKSAVERKEILRLACLNEAEHVSPHKPLPYVRGYSHPYNKTESELKSLCREMDNLADPKKK